MIILMLVIVEMLAAVGSLPALPLSPQPPLSLFPISKEAKPGIDGEAENVEYWDKKSWISSLQNIFKPPLDWNKNTSPTTTTVKATSAEKESTTFEMMVSEMTVKEVPDEVTETPEVKKNSESSEGSTEQSEQPEVLIGRPQDEDKSDDKRKKMPWLAQTVLKHPIHPGVVGGKEPPVWGTPQEANKPQPQPQWEDKKPGPYLPPDGSIQQWMHENRPTHPLPVDSNGRPIKDQVEGKPPKPNDSNKEEATRPSPIKPSYDPPPWEKPAQSGNRPFQTRPVSHPVTHPPNQDFEVDFAEPLYPVARPQVRPPPNVRPSPTLPDIIPDPKPNKGGKPEEQKGWGKPPFWIEKPYPEPGGDNNGLGGNVFGDGTGNGIGGMGNVNGVGGGIIGSGSGNGEGGVGNQNGIGGNVIEDNAANGVGGSGDDNGLGGFVVGNNSGNGKGGVGNNNGIGGNRGGKNSANGTGGVGNHNGKGGIIIGTNSGNGNGGVNDNYRPRP